jgi:[protein-PII] uridylyltransferase
VTARCGSFPSTESSASARARGDATLSDLRAARPIGLEDGSAAARERAAAVDLQLRELIADSLAPEPGVAVVAVGGYGRGELSPHSDIDLLFVAPRRTEINKATLRGLLYPLWDSGWRVGHAVRSAKATIEHVRDDLDGATALFRARFIGGDDDLWLELLDRRALWIRKDRRALTRRIIDATAERHRRAQRAGWSLAPDIKDDAGGLRDLHTVEWLTELSEAKPSADGRAYEAGEVLMAVRETLHGLLRRPGDRLHMDLQPEIAVRLGLGGEHAADDLMAKVHSAARTIERRCTTARLALADAILGGPRRSGSTRVFPGGIAMRDGELTVDDSGGHSDIALALFLLSAVAETGRPPAGRTISWLEAVLSGPAVDRWDEPMRAAFVGLLKGRHAVTALELLDHCGGWTRVLPEWERVRGRAQHDPYHRFTVDGHSFMAVAAVREVIASDDLAAHTITEPDDLDVLHLAALLHDIGKGSGEDHSVVGERLAREVCGRIGLPPRDREDVAALVRHHLLLADTATRRDIDDGSVIEQVAATIETDRRLRLLYLLTAADGMATGEGGWTPWKASLVGQLFRRALVAIQTGEVPVRTAVVETARRIEAFEPALAGRVADVLETLPPSYVDSGTVEDLADELKLLVAPLRSGEIRHRVHLDGDQALVSLCVEDRTGTLARAAGVLSLHRIGVLAARGFSTTGGVAIERFVVSAPPHTSWDRVTQDLEAAFSGRLALDEALSRKASDHHPSGAMVTDIRILPDASPSSTVIEVRAQDALGLLYAIAAGISDLDFDIHVAKIDTLGPRVVDVFYVRTAWGSRLDLTQASALERSVRHRISTLFN